MPAKLTSYFKSNRSQASLLSTQETRPYQPSPIPSPLHSPAFPPYQGDSPLTTSANEEDTHFGHPYEEHRPGTLPSRSHSVRTTTSTVHYPRYSHGASPGYSGSAASTLAEDPNIFYQDPQITQKEDHKKRRFFGLGHSSTSKDSAHSIASPPAGLGRRTSVRKKDTPSEISTDLGTRPTQQRWPSRSSSVASPHDDLAEEDEGGAELIDQPRYTQEVQGPPRPDKSLDEYPFNRLPLQPGSANSYKQQSPGHQPLTVSAFEHAEQLTQQVVLTQSELSYQQRLQQEQEYLKQQSSKNPHPHPHQTSPSSASSTGSRYLPFRDQKETAQHRLQENQSSRPSSQQSYYGPPSPLHTTSRTLDLPAQKLGPPPSPLLPLLRNNEPQHQRLSSQTITAALKTPPPPTKTMQQAQRRGSIESQQNSQERPSRDGPAYQAYSGSGPNQPPNAPPPSYGSQLNVGTQQGGPYRQTPQPSPIPPGNISELGRATPPPSRSRDDLASLDISQLVARYEELQDKYRKVKKYYFDKDAQVQSLQNTLAHQRLSQSRTSLDDNEYATRFSRLDSQINNLAFNLRREWRSIPSWLAPRVNKDAHTSPTKEMTAVGRACISRWLVDELLDRYFHPSLEPALSAQLKIIEKNLRRFAPPTVSDEEKDALMSRISTWRLTTLDGLAEMLASPQAGDYRAGMTTMLVEKLTASLMMHLKEPMPPGLEGGVGMIVELAVGIAANLPLESRDVFVEYVLPGALVNEASMRIEAALPPLTNPGEGEREGDADLKTEGVDMESEVEKEVGKAEGTQAGKKKGMFGWGAGKKGAQAQGQEQRKEIVGVKEERVKFAAFMAVEVRGRSVLVKAPVYV